MAESAAMAGSEKGWRVLRTDDESLTLVHPIHGQACHSRAGAWTEARERYAVACRLRERACVSDRPGRLRQLSIRCWRHYALE